MPRFSARFITLPNADHITLPSTLELAASVTTWLRSMLLASSKLGPRPAALTIEERNQGSVKLMEAANLPAYNWTISSTGEEITVMADRWEALMKNMVNHYEHTETTVQEALEGDHVALVHLPRPRKH